MTKHPRDAADGVTLSLSLSLGDAVPERANKKQHRRADGEFVCKTCSRAFATFQALGGHRTSHLRGRHGGLALGLASASAAPGPGKAAAAAATTTAAEEKQPAHECHFCGAAFEMGQALGGHMRRHREAAATAQAPPVLLQLFV